MDATRRRVLASAAAGAIAVLAGCRRDVAARFSAAADASGLRIDVRHTVRDVAEEFTIVDLIREPGASSLRARAPAWGDFRVSIFDTASRTLLAQMGFDSNVADDAASASTTLTLRCRLPAAPFTLSIEKRRAGSTFQTMLTSPADASLVRAPRAAAVRSTTLVEHGESDSKLDLAIVAEGYTAAEHDKFLEDAKRASGYVLSVEPFKSRSRAINVHAVFAESQESGVSDAYLGQSRRCAFGTSYGSGERERTLSVGDERKLRDAVSAVPYDAMLVIANSRRYGGSAYFGGPAVVAIDSAAARYLVLHELGHALAGLAEEYYIPAADGPAYGGNIEPWQPNVTTRLATQKWRAAEQFPTRWNKREYERWFTQYVKRYEALRSAGAPEAAVEKLMRDALARQAVLLGRARAVGLYESADGFSRGMYRSEPDCIMFSLQSDFYCSACTAALTLAIDAHVHT